MNEITMYHGDNTAQEFWQTAPDVSPAFCIFRNHGEDFWQGAQVFPFVWHDGNRSLEVVLRTMAEHFHMRIVLDPTCEYRLPYKRKKMQLVAV